MAKICGQKNNILSNRPKTKNFPSPSRLFLMLYGWGFAPGFITSPTLSNGGGVETVGQKEKNF